MIRYCLIFCAAFFCIMGCGRGKSKDAGEHVTKAEQVIVKRYPLPFAPDVLKYKVLDSSRYSHAYIAALNNQRKLIKDSMVRIVFTDTIPLLRKQKEMSVLADRYSLINERLAYLLYSECGDSNDCQDVQRYNGSLGVSKEFVLKYAPAIGMLKWRNNIASVLPAGRSNAGNVSNNPWGTGAMISDRYFITAGHCFDTGNRQHWILPSKGGVSLPSSELAKLMRVTFKYETPGLTTVPVIDSVSYEIDSLMEYRCGDFDYAIVRLKKGADNKYPGDSFYALPVSKSPVAIHEMLCVIEHPKGQSKKVQASTAIAGLPGLLQYFGIDTYDCSSGSPVLSAAKNALVGVHVHGGCNQEETEPNRATAISYIVDHSPILKTIAK